MAVINKFILYHYDDRKEETDSHRVTLFEDNLDDNFNQPVFSSSELVGYGDNYDEALDDLLKKLRSRIINLEAFCTMCECTDIIKPKKVDCFDKIIEN